jgi:hypothetical protein
MTINQQQHEFINAHAGALTPELAAQLLEMDGEPQGDTGSTPDQGGAPGVAGDQQPAAPATTDQPAKPAAAAAAHAAAAPAEPDPSNTVILAKDGKHTISYEKLVEAREDAKTWREKAEAAQQQLAALQAQAQQRVDAGQAPTHTDTNVATATAAIDQGVDPAIFGDFSDEAIARGVATLVNRASQAILTQVEAKIAPLQQQRAAEVATSHFDQILAKHPDLDSVVESQQLQDWLKAQPSFARDAYVNVLKAGTATQVIELLDLFKGASPTTTRTAPAPTPAPGNVSAAAAAAIAKAQERVPTSLSDLPGGRAGGAASREEAWAQMDGAALVDAMAEASPEQIERFLNRRA